MFKLEEIMNIFLITDTINNYLKNKNSELRQSLIIFMMPLVKQYVYEEMSDKPRFRSNLDDYLQSGYEILIKTVEKSKFTSYQELCDVLYDNLNEKFDKRKLKIYI